MPTPIDALTAREAAVDQTKRLNRGGDPMVAVAFAIIYLADNLAIAASDHGENLSAALRYVGESIEAAAL